MPGRKTPLITDLVYHVINRGIWSLPIFNNRRDYLRIINAMFYYQNVDVPLSYSKFLSLSLNDRLLRLKLLKKNERFLVEIIAYCLMPNHFHLLLKQVEENGISSFVGKLINSYTRYFNTKNEKVGPILQGRFKAVRVESDEQLLHLSRYIHLNPYSSHILNKPADLLGYSFSSFPEYLGKVEPTLCSKELVLNNFKDREEYEKFVFDQADHQRNLEKIKHLALEK